MTRHEPETIEGRLADLIEGEHVLVGEHYLSVEDRLVIVKALRDRARWMAADINSGERTRKRE